MALPELSSNPGDVFPGDGRFPPIDRSLGMKRLSGQETERFVMLAGRCATALLVQQDLKNLSDDFMGDNPSILELCAGVVLLTSSVIQAHEPMEDLENFVKKKGLTMPPYIFEVNKGSLIYAKNEDGISIFDFLKAPLDGQVIPGMLRFVYRSVNYLYGDAQESESANNSEVGVSPYIFLKLNKDLIGEELPTNMFGNKLTPTEAAAVVRTSSKFINRLDEIQARTREAILTGSSHPSYSGVREVLKDLLEKRAPFALFALGSKETVLIEFFRAIRRNQIEGEDSEFLEAVCENIRANLDLVPEYIFLSAEDVNGVLNDRPGDSEEGRNEDIMGEMKNAIAEIFQKSSNTKYDLDPSVISWDFVAEPNQVIVEFGKNRPQQFHVVYEWINTDGDSMNVIITVDAKKSQFEWNIAEDPNDPIAMLLKDAFLLQTKSILLTILNTATQYYDIRKFWQKTPQGNVLVSSPVEKVRNADPVYALRKETRRPASNLEQETDTSISSVLERGRVKNVIEFSFEGLESLPSGLSHKDRQVVAKKLEEFNEKGIGTLVKVKGKGRKGHEGEILYRLRIGGGVRVLLCQLSSSEGQRKFKLIAVDNRKDIYRRAKII